MIRIPVVILCLLLGFAAQARTELWLPAGDPGEWGPAMPLPAPHDHVLARVRCEQQENSPIPAWTLFLQPAALADDVADRPPSYHLRDESGFSSAEIRSPGGQWVRSARLPRLKWGPWLADRRGMPPDLPDCLSSEVQLRLYREQDRPPRRPVRLEAVRCRAGDPLRQGACTH